MRSLSWQLGWVCRMQQRLSYNAWVIGCGLELELVFCSQFLVDYSIMGTFWKLENLLDPVSTIVVFWFQLWKKLWVAVSIVSEWRKAVQTSLGVVLKYIYMKIMLSHFRKTEIYEVSTWIFDFVFVCLTDTNKSGTIEKKDFELAVEVRNILYEFLCRNWIFVCCFYGIRSFRSAAYDIFESRYAKYWFWCIVIVTNLKYTAYIYTHIFCVYVFIWVWQKVTFSRFTHQARFHNLSAEFCCYCP